MVVKRAHEHLPRIVPALDIPAVEQVQVAVARQVGEAVVVMVHLQLHVFGIQQDTRRNFIVDIPTARGVYLRHEFGVQVEVHGNRVLLLRLEELHVYLPCYRLVAVDNRGGAFAHLYGFHPRPRDILHAERLRQSAHVGRVLRQQLHIGAAQSEQPNLLRACGGVGIRHIHRRTGLETLRQVAARRLA